MSGKKIAQVLFAASAAVSMLIPSAAAPKARRAMKPLLQIIR